MRKREAMKVQAGDRVVYMKQKKGTVRERIDTHGNDRVRLPLFKVGFDDGETFEVTYSLIEREV